MAAEGNSVLAVDSKSGAVLGLFLNEDYCSEDPPGVEAFVESAEGDWAPTIQMIGELEAAFDATYSVPPGNRPPGRWFHLWMLGVATEARVPVRRGRI